MFPPLLDLPVVTEVWRQTLRKAWHISPGFPHLILADGPSHPPGQSQERAGRGGGRLKLPPSGVCHSGPQEELCEKAKDRTSQHISTPLAWDPPLRFLGSFLKYYFLSLGVCAQRRKETKSKKKEIWAGLGASFQDHNLLASHTKPILDLSPQLSQQTGCGGGSGQRRCRKEYSRVSLLCCR